MVIIIIAYGFISILYSYHAHQFKAKALFSLSPCLFVLYPMVGEISSVIFDATTKWMVGDVSICNRTLLCPVVGRHF